MGAPFHYVALTAFCYATEVKERVARALRLAAAGTDSAEMPVSQDPVEGQFGDSLTVLTLTLETAPAIRNFCQRLFPLLHREEAEKRVDDDCFFHLRLSKEAAYAGRLDVVGPGDVITVKGKIRAYPARRENALRVVQEAVAAYHNG